MSERADSIKAGFMVGVGVFLLGLFYLQVTGFSPGKMFGEMAGRDAGTIEHAALLSTSAGVKRGTAVRFGGLQVGEVIDVYVLRASPDDSMSADMRTKFAEWTAEARAASEEGHDQKRLVVLFKVPTTIPIVSDSEVKIAQLSMLGDYHLEVTTGTLAGTLVTAPHTFIGHEPVDLFGEMAALADQIEPILLSVNKILTEDVAALRARVGAVFDQVDTFLASLNEVIGTENLENIAAMLVAMRGIMEDNRPDIRTTLINIRDVSARLKTTLENVDGLVSDARPEVQAILTELNATIAGAERLIENMDGMVMENRPGIKDIVYNMSATAANARELTETLSSEPARLVRPAEPQADGPSSWGGR